MSIRRLLFQWTSTIKIQLSVLVWYKVDLIIILLKINLFSPWYSWEIAELVLNNNHSLNLINQTECLQSFQIACTTLNKWDNPSHKQVSSFIENTGKSCDWFTILLKSADIIHFDRTWLETAGKILTAPFTLFNTESQT